ncbi:MAG TPA: GAF domain-containing protein [bacterium]|nr:GAF domain-containing protein [bacterium]
MLGDEAPVAPVVVTIGRALLFLTKAEHAALFLRSPNGLVSCPWSHNLSDLYLQDIVTPKGANPWLHILRRPELSCMDLPKTKGEKSSPPWFLPDALALSSDHAHLVDRITREGLRSICAWPLTHAGRVTGAFVYYYDSPHVYSQEEQEVMSAFGSQAAAALRDPGAALSPDEGTMNAKDATRTPTDSPPAFVLKTAGSAPKQQIVDGTGTDRPELKMTQATAPGTGAQEAGKLHEYVWNPVAKVGQEPREQPNAAGRSRWREATPVAITAIATVAIAVLVIGRAPHGPAVRTVEHKPAAQASATAVQKLPVPTPHRAISAGVVRPAAAKGGVLPTTSRALQPRKPVYVVVVGTFESANVAEQVKHLVQSKGYVVHVEQQGAVSKVVTAPMPSRTQAEGVARGLETVGLKPQLMVLQEPSPAK